MHDDMKKEYPTSPQAVYFLSCSALPLIGLKIQNMAKAKVWNMAQDIAWCLDRRGSRGFWEDLSLAPATAVHLNNIIRSSGNRF